MNEPTFDPRELEQLELATRNSLPADAHLDGETAALREGYLAFSQLLESQPAERPAKPASVRVRPRGSRVAATIAAFGAVAALLLAMLVGSWFWQPTASPPAIVQKNRAVETHPVESPSSAAAPSASPLPQEAKQKVVASTPATPKELFTWDDSLDDALERSSLHLTAFRQQTSVLDSELNSLDGRIERMQNELNTGSL